ncbi:MAG: PBS lyase HEAT-like repeat protein [Methanoregula sp. PtaU1.Bin051]|nr:MAG: PBS lyase HEAT-like repeat protein [Methanoregula sp. PtaU1.Bin051]
MQFPLYLLSHLLSWRHVPQHTIDALRLKGDLRSLAGLLENRHPDVQWRAAEALGAAGPAATGTLVKCLDNHHVAVRLGALEALAEIRDPTCVPALIDALAHDPNAEVQWAAAIALGQIGDPRAIGPLVESLKSPDKFIRFGAAGSLHQLDWVPENTEQAADLSFAFQNWKALKGIGPPAVPLLIRALSDKDRQVRNRAVEILGEMRGGPVQQACNRALSDPDAGIRWKAVLASTKCGIPIIDLPLYVSCRPRMRPNPYAAAVLNLFFLGLGYNYLGKWWGFLIFMSYMTMMVILSIEINLDLPLFSVYPNLYSYPVTALFAYQTYRMAGKVPDL